VAASSPGGVASGELDEAGFYAEFAILCDRLDTRRAFGDAAAEELGQRIVREFLTEWIEHHPELLHAVRATVIAALRRVMGEAQA
jgi:hypothetical protein